MDELSEAGLDLELSEFGKRLDSLLISRGWNPRARLGQRSTFEFSAKRYSPDTVHIILDAVMPEAAAREIMALALRHGLAEPTQQDTPSERR